MEGTAVPSSHYMKRLLACLGKIVGHSVGIIQRASMSVIGLTPDQTIIKKNKAQLSCL